MKESIPADQLSVIWRLLSPWLSRCPFQPFLLPAEAQEEGLITQMSYQGSLKLHCAQCKWGMFSSEQPGESDHFVSYVGVCVLLQTIFKSEVIK